MCLLNIISMYKLCSFLFMIFYACFCISQYTESTDMVFCWKNSIFKNVNPNSLVSNLLTFFQICIVNCQTWICLSWRLVDWQALVPSTYLKTDDRMKYFIIPLPKVITRSGVPKDQQILICYLELITNWINLWF